MAKAPAAGRVKTRLSPHLSPHEAAAVAEAALVDTLAAAGACGAERKVVALDGDPGPWLPPGFEVVPQGGGGLDDRLAQAWRFVGGPAVQIGMDTPQVTPELLDDALSSLDAADAALGMAEDGGWWAIALRTADPAVFLGVPMSTVDTGAAQRRRLEHLGLTVANLPVLRDIDHLEDLVAVARAHPFTVTARVTAQLMTTRLDETG